jgi:hypothetical protein
MFRMKILQIIMCEILFTTSSQELLALIIFTVVNLQMFQTVYAVNMRQIIIIFTDHLLTLVSYAQIGLHNRKLPSKLNVYPLTVNNFQWHCKIERIPFDLHFVICC